MKKNIIKFIAFVLILIFILIILSYIFVPKNNSKEFGMEEDQAKGIFGEKDNSVDVIMYGDSETIASTMPMKLWEDYGFTMHVCGEAGQTLPDTCRMAYDTMKKQQPKLVILESNNIYNSVNVTVPIARVINIMFPITEYHNRWKNLKLKDFYSKIEYNTTDINKGYYYVGRTDPVEDNTYMEKTEEIEKIPFLNKLYIKFLKYYSEKKGAQFAIVSVPSKKNWSYAKHNGVKEFADKEGIEFLDLNELKEELNIDWQTETGDKGDHVNYKGAIKVTNYLGKWLKDKNILENHKDDQNYDKWNKDLEEFKKNVKY